VISRLAIRVLVRRFPWTRHSGGGAIGARWETTPSVIDRQLANHMEGVLQTLTFTMRFLSSITFPSASLTFVTVFVDSWS